MFCLNGSHRFYLYTCATDMRKGFGALGRNISWIDCDIANPKLLQPFMYILNLMTLDSYPPARVRVTILPVVGAIR